jgi:glycerol-3-phosphate dehydrogenase subunit C
MCATYCGAFPLLFQAVDRDVDRGAQGAEELGAELFESVSDHCWQCKLCFVKCPYTVDDGAPELVDFPRLMARVKAQRARRQGVAWVDQLLGEPQWIGWLGAGKPAPFANLVSANRLVRRAAEKVTGISSEFPLPPMAETNVFRWFGRHVPDQDAGRAGEVALFPTCYAEFNFADVAVASVQVLEKNGLRVWWPEGLTCCGMPNLDGGDVNAATEKMRQNVDVLWPLVRRGMKVVIPGPTCGYLMKKELSTYLDDSRATEVASATVDLMELLERKRRDKTLNTHFPTSLGKVAYHAACHLRAQKMGVPGARVLSAVPGTEVRIIERCSAVDGTWGMKAQFYQEGARFGKRLVASIVEQESALVVSDCSLAGLRILKETGKQPLHPVQALGEAYGLPGLGRLQSVT